MHHAAVHWTYTSALRLGEDGKRMPRKKGHKLGAGKHATGQRKGKGASRETVEHVGVSDARWQAVLDQASCTRHNHGPARARCCTSRPNVRIYLR